MLRLRQRTILHLVLAAVLIWVGSLFYIARHNRQTQRDEVDPLSDNKDQHIFHHKQQIVRADIGGIPASRNPELELHYNMARLDTSREEDLEHKRQSLAKWKQRSLEANLSYVRGLTVEDEPLLVGSNPTLQTNDVDILVEKGLLIPKWNVDVEVPEDPGDPGKKNYFI